MKPIIKKRMLRERRHLRLRNKVAGTTARPRLCVTRSLRQISAQIIDDSAGRTLLTVTSLKVQFSDKARGGNAAGAKLVGQQLAAAAKSAGITEVVFDRGGRKYHGRVKALADAARENGLKF